VVSVRQQRKLANHQAINSSQLHHSLKIVLRSDGFSRHHKSIKDPWYVFRNADWNATPGSDADAHIAGIATALKAQRMSKDFRPSLRSMIFFNLKRKSVLGLFFSFQKKHPKGEYNRDVESITHLTKGIQ